MNLTLPKDDGVSPLALSSEPIYQRRENGFWILLTGIRAPGSACGFLSLSFTALSSSQLASFLSPLRAIEARTGSCTHPDWMPLEDPGTGQGMEVKASSEILTALTEFIWVLRSCCHCCGYD